MEVLEKEEKGTRCIYRLIKGRGGKNVLPSAILVKLIDVANYCSNIFNCILALKRIKTEFPSLCLKTVSGRHSSICTSVDTAAQSLQTAHVTEKPYSQLFQTYLGLKGAVRKRTSVF